MPPKAKKILKRAAVTCKKPMKAMPITKPPKKSGKPDLAAFLKFGDDSELPDSPGGVAQALKKPAAAPTPTKVKAKMMKKPAAQGKVNCSEPQAADDGGDDDTTRNRMKFYYFQQNYQNFPVEVQELFSNSSRKEQTLMVNKLMKPTGNKGFAFDETSPVFTEMRSKFERRFATEQDRGVIRAVAEQRCGGKLGLQEAIEAGDVRVTTGGDGRQFYVLPELISGKTVGTTFSRSISQKGNVSTEAAAEMSQMLANLGWGFDFSSRQEQAINTKSS